MDTTLIIILLTVSLIILLFLTTTIIIYGEKIMRSRKIIRSGTKLVWPNHFENMMVDLISNIEDLIQKEKKKIEIADDLNKSGMESIDKMNESISIFTETRSELEKELNFYKKGAEKNYVERFWEKFIRFRNYMHEAESNTDNSDQTKEVVGSLLEYFDDALQDFGICFEYPKVGINFKTSDCVAENPTLVPTDDAAKDFEIISYQTPAFYYEIEDNKKYISKSKVTIFRLKGETDGENNRN